MSRGGAPQGKGARGGHMFGVFANMRSRKAIGDGLEVKILRYLHTLL
jgi:hypothetical protein